MFAKSPVLNCIRLMSSRVAQGLVMKPMIYRVASASVGQMYFSTDAKTKQSAEEIKKKVKEVTEKVKEDRLKEASKVKVAQTVVEPEIKIVKQEECFTTVLDPDGQEITFQTKAVDSTGKQPVEEKVTKLVDEILQLNFVQIGQFINLFKDRLGLSGMITSPMMMNGGGGAEPAAAAAAAEPEVKQEEKKEKKTANVKLIKYDDKDKIKIIKEVRGILGLGLRESKTLVESAPVLLKENMPKKDAEALVAKLKELGAETLME